MTPLRRRAYSRIVCIPSWIVRSEYPDHTLEDETNNGCSTLHPHGGVVGHLFFEGMAREGVYPKDMDWHKAFTLQFVNKKHGMEALR